jgi:hypothetical protein
VLKKLNLSAAFVASDLGAISKTFTAKSSVMKLSPIFSLDFDSFSCYVWAFGLLSPFSYIILGNDPTSFFCMWILSFPSTFVEKMVLIPLNGLGILVKVT